MQAQPDSLRPTQLSFERGQRAMIKVFVLAASGRERRSRVEVCVTERAPQTVFPLGMTRGAPLRYAGVITMTTTLDVVASSYGLYL